MEVTCRKGEAEVSEEKTTVRRKRGRPIEHYLEDDLSIIFALSRKGAASSINNLSSAFSMPQDLVTQIIDKLSASVDGIDRGTALPVASLGNNRFCRSSDTRDERLRLTPEQADAYCGALDRLGIARDSRERHELEGAIYPLDYSRPEPPQESAITPDELNTLMVCARSIVRGRRHTSSHRISEGREPNQKTTKTEVKQPVVSFTYLSERGMEVFKEAIERRVVPLDIRIHEGKWVVDAHDLEGKKTKTFQVERMHEAILTGQTATVEDPDVEQPGSAQAEGTHLVLITCSDKETVHALLALDGTRIIEREPHLIVAVPYYGGQWLPRHLIPLLDSISFDDEQLAKDIRKIAKDDLSYMRRFERRRQGN